MSALWNPRIASLVTANHRISTDDQSRFFEQAATDLTDRIVPLTSPPLNSKSFDVDQTYMVMDALHEVTDHVDIIR